MSLVKMIAEDDNLGSRVQVQVRVALCCAALPMSLITLGMQRILNEICTTMEEGREFVETLAKQDSWFNNMMNSTRQFFGAFCSVYIYRSVIYQYVTAWQLQARTPSKPSWTPSTSG